MKNIPELISPAGSRESLRAAIQAGADAVYFGVEHLNMRARSANNFSLSDLPEIVGICKENNVSPLLTLNTILYDHDVSLMKRIVDEAKKSGIPAVIASDPALLDYASEVGMPVHISTQANISNIGSVRFFSHYADVMVLARELTLEQVKKIADEINRKKITGPSGKPVQLEVFVHGALCMAVSGKCYLSLHSDFASANRGACVQNCRRSYVVTDKESGNELEIDHEYIMSAKDLSTIGFLDKIIHSGVSVLKIEGRGRSEEYVYTVTACYREALDAIAADKYTKEKIAAWEKRLAAVFNRGFWDGYYLGRKMGEWSDAAGSKASTKKIYIGKGVKYYDRIGVGAFRIETGTLSCGDKVIISGPSTGVVYADVNEIRVEDAVKDKAVKGEIISIPLKEKVRPSDKLYKLVPC